MNKITTIFFTVLLMLSVNAQNVSKIYESKEGNFSALFKGEVSASTQTVPSDLGQLELKMYLWAVDDQMMVVATCDYPADKLQGTVFDKAYFDKVLGGQLGAFKNASVLGSEMATLGNHPAMIYAALAESENQPVKIVGKIVMVSNRLYQVTSVSTTAAFNEVEVASFIDSFRLINDIK